MLSAFLVPLAAKRYQDYLMNSIFYLKAYNNGSPILEAIPSPFHLTDTHPLYPDYWMKNKTIKRGCPGFHTCLNFLRAPSISLSLRVGRTQVSLPAQSTQCRLSSARIVSGGGTSQCPLRTAPSWVEPNRLHTDGSILIIHQLKCLQEESGRSCI